MHGQFTCETTGKIFPLEGNIFVGRGADSTIQLKDVRMSRRHAMIRRQPDGFWFFDLGSFNGSYLNGSRVTASLKLTDGDRIEIGDQVLRFTQSGTTEAADMEGMEASTIGMVRYGDAIILVCDILGYSALSEQLSPEQLAPIIGSWYAQTERILAEHGATLDKFIGDCALAYWTDTSPKAKKQALRTAGAMQLSNRATADAHKDVLESNGLTFSTGTSIHAGSVAYGGVSAQGYTLLGDAVNVAFRMETLTRELGYHVMTSAEFLADWPEGERYCSQLGTHLVKGRLTPVDVWAVTKIPGNDPNS